MITKVFPSKSQQRICVNVAYQIRTLGPHIDATGPCYPPLNGVIGGVHLKKFRIKDSTILCNLTGSQPSVNTTSGLVYGVTVQQGQIFFGIPYAEPPVGELR